MTGLLSPGLPSSIKSVDTVPDYVVVFGDMNFRVDLEPKQCLKFLSEIKKTNKRGMLYQQQVSALLQHDQLTKSLRKDSCLHRLREKNITFLPTYKLHQQSDDYSIDKKRTPSWYTYIEQGQTEYSHTQRRQIVYSCKSTAVCLQSITPITGRLESYTDLYTYCQR